MLDLKFDFQVSRQRFSRAVPLVHLSRVPFTLGTGVNMPCAPLTEFTLDRCPSPLRGHQAHPAWVIGAVGLTQNHGIIKAGKDLQAQPSAQHHRDTPVPCPRVRALPLCSAPGAGEAPPGQSRVGRRTLQKGKQAMETLGLGWDGHGDV